MSLAGAKSSEEKCDKCSTALCPNTFPARCRACNNGFHQKYSTGPKASNCYDQWKCDTSIKVQQNQISASNVCQLPGSTNLIPSQPQPVASRNKLKMYQWNSDGIPPKFPELRDLLINSRIDVLAVQESGLQEVDKTPFVEGYATVRKNCSNILGGGLLLFIGTDIVFEKLHSFEKAGMEILSIHLKTSKLTWLKQYNIYLLNITIRQNSFDPSLIKPSPTSIILGDFNGHSQLWNPLQPPDARGDKILGWILDNDLQILNDGSDT